MDSLSAKKNPTIWMNVTTSVNWNRPPVGIVRVEQELCAALEKLLGPEKFKQCTWTDGNFVEWIPYSKVFNPVINKAIDIIFPNTSSFDILRKLLARALEFFKRKESNQIFSPKNDLLEIEIPINSKVTVRPKAGDILISVGLDWDHPYISDFFTLSKKNGIKIITCCYDLIPVLFPQYCVGDVAHRFKDYFNQLTWGSSAVLCISKQTEKDYLSLCKQLGAPERPTCVFPLGDSIPASTDNVLAPLIKDLLTKPFILFVSTIERRKNHEVLYRAYHLLCKAGYQKILPKLIFVGMPGWGVGNLLKDIELDPLTQEFIIQLNYVTDSELHTLYQKALFCVYPSLYEGWGLPVGEALAMGKAVLSSQRGSLPEVGGDLVRYLDPWNVQAWADAILELVTSPDLIKEMERNVAQGYTAKTWMEAAKCVAEFTNKLFVNNKTELVLYPGYDFSTQVGLHKGAYIQSTGERGYLMHGPYLPLSSGQYRVEIFDLPDQRTFGEIYVDLVTDQGNKCHWQGNINVNPKSNTSEPLLHFDVLIDEEISDFEIRCIIDSAQITLSKVVITKL